MHGWTAAAPSQRHATRFKDTDGWITQNLPLAWGEAHFRSAISVTLPFCGHPPLRGGNQQEYLKKHRLFTIGRCVFDC